MMELLVVDHPSTWFIVAFHTSNLSLVRKPQGLQRTSLPESLGVREKLMTESPCCWWCWQALRRFWPVLLERVLYQTSLGSGSKFLQY